MEASASDKKRSAVWGEAETMSLIDMVSEEEFKLFGSHEAPTAEKSTSKKRQELWARITDKLNAQFINKKRIPEEVMKKYNNMKQRAKVKYDAKKKYSKITGGGPPPKSFTAAEEHLINHMDGRPILIGLSGVDSDQAQEVETSQIHQEAIQENGTDERLRQENAEVVLDVEEFSGDVQEQSGQDTCTQTAGQKKSTIPRGKKRKMDHMDALCEENLQLDNLKLTKEIQKLDLEIDLLKEKKANEVKKRELMDTHINYLNKKISLNILENLIEQ